MGRRTPLHPDHLSFALTLDARLRGGSRVWSPFSVGEALGLVATGTRGRTRSELEALLGAGLTGHLDALAEALEPGGTGAPELESATSLWIREGLKVDPGFSARLAGRRASSVRTADFANDPEGVRKAANTEVGELTRGLIPELLQPGDVASSTQAMLLNALWVRLSWTVPFDPGATAPARFHAPGGPVDTPMMHRRGEMPLARSDGWAMATLVGGEGLYLDVLLPPERADDADTAPLPSSAVLERLYASATPAQVRLALPRFEITGRSLLSSALSDAGAPTVFTGDSDLSGIVDRRLLIDEVVHQARLRVDEKGAEGAAATAVVMRTASLAPPPRPEEFIADRPFAFILRRNGAALFAGGITEPEDPGPAT
ncbi:serpin family protein [Nocardiopsis sp. RSe5-2]|uniref:Serpin family protein n=1 Tax=Nocardiopsis endophytica TaxID=3018445 RepID=A0ABT4U947_9ACTN|nr:serpin family protein [Nocardiopsis endophytica]MDA2813474.1 serpin family protein [Nocardiopsis endophytica]